MSIQQLQEFLNSHNIKYTTISYSPAHTTQDLANYKSRLGMDLIQAVPVEIENQRIIIAILPASRQINLGSLEEAFKTNKLRLLEQKEVENLFPNCEFGTLPPFGELYDKEVFGARDLVQNQEVTFYAYSYAHLVRMNYGDFEKLVNLQQKIAFSTRSIYRAKVRDVIPISARQEFRNHEHCFFRSKLRKWKLFHSQINIYYRLDW